MTNSPAGIRIMSNATIAGAGVAVGGGVGVAVGDGRGVDVAVNGNCVDVAVGGIVAVG